MNLGDHLKLLALLIGRPSQAMNAILDRGSILYASVTVLLMSLFLRSNVFSFYTPFLLLAIVYVPGVILIAQLIGGWGGVSVDFRRDYSPLLTCAAMAWSIAAIPLLVLERTPAVLAGAGFAIVYFAALMFFAIRTVFGARNGISAAVVGLSWLPLVAAAFFIGPIRYIFGWLASPFFLFYAYYYLGGELTNLGAGFRRQQSFRRMLEASTVNAHDAESRYQLGLIYQERRQLTEAIQRFSEAVAIDPGETDAHFQLGRIALEQGRLKDAFPHFQTVINQDEKHHSYEILRELGRMYLAAKQYPDAERELAAYTGYREYDPEGLYYYGEALEGTGKPNDAAMAYRRAIEAAAAAPHYRRRQIAKWSRLAQKAAQKLKRES